MLHLFDKIYVCPDFLLDASKNRIIISHADGLDQNSRLSPIKHCVKTFDELPYKNWQALLENLEYAGKLRFYVDMPAFDIIFVNWVKTIFPNITDELAFYCYNAYVQRLTLHFPAIVLNRGFLDYNKFNLQNLKFLSKQEFYELFNSTQPWDDEQARKEWVEKHKEGFSIEWHMANYFNDEKHLDVFRDKYIYVLTKALAMEVSEWYFYVIKYFMQPNVKQAFDININWDDTDWRGKLRAHPKLGWMFDNELKFITRDSAFFLAHLDQILELGTYLQDFWFKDIQIDDKTRLLDEDYFESNHAHFVFDTLKSLIQKQDYLSADEINSIIKKDFERENVSIVFDILTHVQKWNGYLLQLVYELKNKQDPRLKQLVFE